MGTPAERSVFFVSDGTGITAETLGHSVLTQFNFTYRQVRLPFIDDVFKARAAVERINLAAQVDGLRPIVFSTLVKPEVNAIVRAANALSLDLFASYVVPLEVELGMKATNQIGRSHNIADSDTYNNRIDAINFSLAHDDGQSHTELAKADVILVGVSRCGKTPTSLYLAMQFGIKAANYPLIPEDFERGQLPHVLPEYRHKLFGLTIHPERLSEIRNERRPGSKYAALENCRYEVAAAEKMMRLASVRWASTTHKSIEEIAATIIAEVRLEQRSY
jgi:regulator of PEP synthase PpsR (kinase-PPPase family)